MTAIEWTDQTWNPVRGCARVSPGCENCYAERMAGRLVTMGGAGAAYRDLVRHGPNGARWTGRVTLDAATLAAPLLWRKPRRVFVNSMSDLFHESLSDEQIAAVFGVMAATPQHTYQVLTKRAERMASWFEWMDENPAVCNTSAQRILPEHLKRLDVCPVPPLSNVWLGVSVEDQQRADERVPQLLACPAAVRFLSVEPMIGAVDLMRWFPFPGCTDCGVPVATVDEDGCCKTCGGDVAAAQEPGVDWVIVGGESGPGARPCDVAWIRSIVEQCKAAAVSVFVKQLGARPEAREIGDMGPETYRAWDAEHAGEPFPSDGVVMHMRDRKGGDPIEWPDDLRVRQWPVVTS